jgi:hypothetical protein
MVDYFVAKSLLNRVMDSAKRQGLGFSDHDIT